MTRESHFPIIDAISLDQILRASIDTACGFGLYTEKQVFKNKRKNASYVSKMFLKNKTQPDTH